MLKYPIIVTIDTNIFDATKYDFSEESTLQLLKSYVAEGTIKVVLSNIVVREAKKHLAKQVTKVCSIARKQRTEVLKESTEHLINYIGLNRLLEITNGTSALVAKSEELFDNFIQEINAEILGTDLINLDGIIDDYFEINPPFEPGEKKRKEFPDAFIANQIRKRFGDTEPVAIVSNDKGFMKACQQAPNHFFFSSLGELYDNINKINKEKAAAYEKTISIITELQFNISSAVLEYIKSNENIAVRGLSYDKDGNTYGFDYDEIYLHSISNVTFMVHSVDEVSDKTSKVTLLCRADISADCYYDDYENSPWDSETKDYIFIDTIGIREEHYARFGCRIELNREEKKFSILPFTVVLGGDSRKKLYKIQESSAVNYEKEIQDMDRKSLGFVPLGSYESYLEDDLPNSVFFEEIVKRFEILNGLKHRFEYFSISYESLLEELNNSDSRKIIKSIYEKLLGISDVPRVANIEDIEDYEIEEIKKWIIAKSEKASSLADENTLPDTINYGESIVIKGIDGSELTFAIDEITITPTEGSEETISISLLNSIGEKISGHIKLTVGYLYLDEDGGASDGIDDEIEYEYQEIIQEMDRYIFEQNQITEKESKIIEIVEPVLCR